MNQKNFFYKALFNVIRTFVSIVFPLITFMYISRMFQPDGIGKINFSKSFVAYFTFIGMSGITNYGAREASKCVYDKDKLSKTCHEIIFINTACVIIAYILLLVVMNNPLFKTYTLFIALYSITIISTMLSVEWIYIAEENYLYPTIINALVSTISFLLLIYLVKGKNDIVIYIEISNASAFIAGIANFLYVRKYIAFKRYADYEIKRHIAPILNIFLMTLCIQVFTHLDTTMLGILAGDYYTGLYTAANRMCGMSSTLITAIAMVFMPEISRREDTKENVSELIEKAVNIIVMLGLPLAAILQLLSKNFIMLLCGEEYLKAHIAAVILSFRAILVPLNSFFVLYLFIPLKKEKWNLISTGAAALTNFAVNCWLIPLFQEKGAAIATVLAECIELMVNICFLSRLEDLRKLAKSFWKYIIALMFAIALGCLCKNIRANNIVSMCMIGVVTLSTYFTVLYVLNNKYIKQFFKSKIK